MNSDSLNVVSRLGEGHMPGTFFLSEPQLKTTVARSSASQILTEKITNPIPAYRFLHAPPKFQTFCQIWTVSVTSNF